MKIINTLEGDIFFKNYRFSPGVPTEVTKEEYDEISKFYPTQFEIDTEIVLSPGAIEPMELDLSIPPTEEFPKPKKDKPKKK